MNLTARIQKLEAQLQAGTKLHLIWVNPGQNPAEATRQYESVCPIGQWDQIRYLSWEPAHDVEHEGMTAQLRAIVGESSND